MLTHALRKYFDTEARKAGVYPDIVELLMGHKLPGVRKHYFKPDINKLLEGTKEVKGYVAAIDSLTINEENRLQKQVEQIEQQNDYQKYIIDKKMKGKDEELEIPRSKIREYDEVQNEGRIISREQSERLDILYEKFEELTAKFDTEKEN